MTKITVDHALLLRLNELRESTEFCDETGHTLGYFQPVPSRDRALYEGLKIPITEEQLRAAELETEEYTTGEVLAHLRELENQ
jgi:hypothetical protein